MKALSSRWPGSLFRTLVATLGTALVCSCSLIKPYAPVGEPQLPRQASRNALNDYEAFHLSGETLAKVRVALGLGGNGGPAILDQATRDAIRKKQQQLRFPVTGELSQALVERIVPVEPDGGRPTASS